MRAVRISAKLARALLGMAKTSPARIFYESTVAELERALAVKPAIRERRKVKAAKKETRRERFSAIRKKVEARAGGRCECGCGFAFMDWEPGEADHFFGKARAESVETVWMLTRLCHRMKTENDPDAATWLARFSAHCARHGYRSEAARAEARLFAIETTRNQEKPNV